MTNDELEIICKRKIAQGYIIYEDFLRVTEENKRLRKQIEELEAENEVLRDENIKLVAECGRLEEIEERLCEQIDKLPNIDEIRWIIQTETLPHLSKKRSVKIAKAIHNRIKEYCHLCNEYLHTECKCHNK